MGICWLFLIWHHTYSLKESRGDETVWPLDRGRPQMRWEERVKIDIRQADVDGKWREKAANREK